MFAQKLVSFLQRFTKRMSSMKRVSIRACKLELPTREGDLPVVVVVGGMFPYMLYKNLDNKIGFIDLLDGVVDEDLVLFDSVTDAIGWLQEQFPNSTIEIVKELMLTV